MLPRLGARGRRGRAGDPVRVLLPDSRSCATRWRNPERARKLVFFGTYAARDDIPDATRRSLVDFARVNWLLATQMFAGLLNPHGSGDEIAALSRYKRHAAEAEVAAAFLELDSLIERARARAAGHRACARPAPPGRPHGADRPGPRASPPCSRTPASSP